MNRMKLAAVLVMSATVATLGAVAPATAASAAAKAAEPDGSVTVWTDGPGLGEHCTWYGDDRDYRFNTGCPNMNDKVSAAYNRGFPGNRGDVLFWENIHYTGDSICLKNGRSWDVMPRGWNDRISSHQWANCG